jgi:hypothetical protein
MIHHRSYDRLGHERRADVTVPCWDCHRREHHAPREAPSRASTSVRAGLVALIHAAAIVAIAVVLLELAVHR